MSPTVPRLKRRAEFLRVARSGRRWAAPGLVLQAWNRSGGTQGEPESDKQKADGTGVRVGFTASRKVGNAVKRNRVKRRLRSAAERILPAHGKPGHDFVLIGRAGTLGRSYPALLADLVTALKKVKAFEGPEPDIKRKTIDGNDGGREKA